jgi:hypothetical protein
MGPDLPATVPGGQHLLVPRARGLGQQTLRITARELRDELLRAKPVWDVAMQTSVDLQQSLPQHISPFLQHVWPPQHVSSLSQQISPQQVWAFLQQRCGQHFCVALSQQLPLQHVCFSPQHFPSQQVSLVPQHFPSQHLSFLSQQRCPHFFFPLGQPHAPREHVC